VRLALETLLALARSLGGRAGGDEVVPAEDLGADEAARDVGVDRRRRVEGGLAAAQRPGPRLLLARREERDQVERLGEPPRHLAEPRGRLAELGRLLLGQIVELRLQPRGDPVATVLYCKQRLHRTRQ